MSWRVESKIRIDIRYQHRDSTQILDINIVIRIDFSILKS